MDYKCAKSARKIEVVSFFIQYDIDHNYREQINCLEKHEYRRKRVLSFWLSSCSFKNLIVRESNENTKQIFELRSPKSTYIIWNRIIMVYDY